METSSSTEIIGLILRAVEAQPLTCSKIMFQAILKFQQVTDYTAYMAKEGLLMYHVQERKYAITDRGKQFLTLFKETNKLLNSTTTSDPYNVKSSDSTKIEAKVGLNE